MKNYTCGSCGVPDKLCNCNFNCVADVWHAAQRAERRKTVRRVRPCNTAQPAILELVGRYCDAEDLTIDLRGEVVRFAKWVAQEQQAGT